MFVGFLTSSSTTRLYRGKSTKIVMVFIVFYSFRKLHLELNPGKDMKWMRNTTIANEQPNDD